MSKDSVLVTGVGGLIGAEVASRFAQRGCAVVGMDRSPPLGFKLPFVSHDLPDPHRWYQVIREHRVNKIVHAGGVSGPMLLNDSPNRIVQINLDGLTGLLEAARIEGIERIIGFSSVVAYGDHPDLSEITEKSWLNPSSIYGATKVAGDALVNAYFLSHGVDMVTFRVAGGYGPGRITPCLIRLLIEDALAGRKSLVCEDPHRTRQYIFVDDVVDAVVKAMDQPKLPQRTYNIGPGVIHTARDVISALQACLPNAQAEIDPAGMRWNSFGVGLLNIEAARRDFGFEPATDLVEGVRKTMEWVLQRQVPR